MKVKPVKEKKNINYPKLAVLTAAVSLTAALSGCIEAEIMGKTPINESNQYFGGTSGNESSEITLEGDFAVFEDCSSSNCSDNSRNCSECSAESNNSSDCSDTSTEVALTGEVPESNN